MQQTGDYMRKILYSLAIASIAFSANLAGSVSQAEARGKLCKAEHFHTWSASGHTKRGAMKAALSGWRTYTAIEYGNAWAHFRLAGNRSLRCSQSGRRSWSCTATGRPCRRS